MSNKISGNGVVCHYCFKTVNLSELPKESVRHPRLTRFLTVEPHGTFRLTCPHCGKKDRYPYYHVQPMTMWTIPIEELQQRLLIVEAERDKAEAERDKARADAITFAKELDAKNKEPFEVQENPNGEQTEDKSPSSAKPPQGPQPPERKIDNGVY